MLFQNKKIIFSFYNNSIYDEGHWIKKNVLNFIDSNNSVEEG